MLLNLHKKSWGDNLKLKNYEDIQKKNEEGVKQLLTLANEYNKSVREESKLSKKQLEIRNVGKQDPKRHLEEKVEELLNQNVSQNIGACINASIVK